VEDDTGSYTEGMRSPFANGNSVIDRVQMVDLCNEATHEQVHVGGSDERNCVGRCVVTDGEWSTVLVQPAVHAPQVRELLE